MFNHAPPDYVCPFCLIVGGIENEQVLTRQQDIVYKDDFVTAFVSSHWWKNNPGHVVIIPNRHFENIYDLPLDYATEIQRVACKVALALKEAYHCPGISTRQHNEPDGQQDVWHFHLHVFPRYPDDKLYKKNRRYIKPSRRLPYAVRLKQALLLQDADCS